MADPHAQSLALKETPMVLMQWGTKRQLPVVDVQKYPVWLVQALVLHKHVPLFDVAPFVWVQMGAAMQMQ